MEGEDLDSMFGLSIWKLSKHMMMFIWFVHRYGYGFLTRP